MKYFLGIDLGGTNISAGVVDEEYKLLSSTKLKTNSERPYIEILPDIIEVAKNALIEADVSIDKIKSIGIGCPGTCNKTTGIVEYSNNLKWNNVPLCSDIETAFNKKTYIDNDANAAAFGEYLNGAARGADTAVVITLGTGVGAGVIINGHIYTGVNFAGAELGHTVISIDGYPCTCGRKGCFESYASAVALVRMTKEADEKYKGSKIHELVEKDGKYSGRTAFNAAKLNDEAGKEVVETYIKYLACGITNAINIFQPDILCIGGGVCNEGDNLLLPLRKAVKEQVFSKNSEKNTEIVICSLGNAAGIIGAACLGKSL